MTPTPARPPREVGLLRLDADEFNELPAETQRQIEVWARGNGVPYDSPSVGVVCVWANYRADGTRRLYVKTVTKADPLEVKIAERPMPAPLPADLAECFTAVPHLDDPIWDDPGTHRASGLVVGSCAATRAATPLLCLDIDGTVRQGKDDPLGRWVNGPEDVRVFPQAVEMMRRWKKTGGRIVGVSNQGGVALGYVTAQLVAAAMRETQRQADDLFDKIMFCAHHPATADPPGTHCWCRKPNPGMLITAARALGDQHREYYPPRLALMVGDRPEDEECARLAGLSFKWAADWRALA